MNLSTRLSFLALAFVALIAAQYFFFPVYIFVFTQNGPLLLMLRL